MLSKARCVFKALKPAASASARAVSDSVQSVWLLTYQRSVLSQQALRHVPKLAAPCRCFWRRCWPSPPLLPSLLVEMPLSFVADVLASGLIHPSHVQELCFG